MDDVSTSELFQEYIIDIPAQHLMNESKNVVLNYDEGQNINFKGQGMVNLFIIIVVLLLFFPQQLTIFFKYKQNLFAKLSNSKAPTRKYILHFCNPIC